MMVQVSNLRTLVLNADMQPLSWAPLSVWSWQQALVAILQDRVTQLKAYEDVRVHSASRPFEVPAVVALKSYRKQRKVSFTRYHVFLRDEFTCQYCGKRFAAKDLTFDHVMPRSRAGGSRWDNIVTSCGPDNHRKGNRTPREAGMRLLRPPFEPTARQLDAAARRLPWVRGDLHQTWMDFLYWGSELDE
ncbi:HNH endonuclease [Xinfangfangia sp. D13-10-4-6]|uniref:HNH endonuclease n=1 Tax=Pseudogemmobacter hezensis TaxID=2737662 RepID=UPI001552EF81|nr:HNH endonuclease [Pseudogemmobacter hezensis]NPD13582.1 HNH endonuclease [Pseudogemmobacter hezensis]